MTTSYWQGRANVAKHAALINSVQRQAQLKARTHNRIFRQQLCDGRVLPDNLTICALLWTIVVGMLGGHALKLSDNKRVLSDYPIVCKEVRRTKIQSTNMHAPNQC